jgi:hypothetical protein
VYVCVREGERKAWWGLVHTEARVPGRGSRPRGCGAERTQTAADRDVALRLVPTLTVRGRKLTAAVADMLEREGTEVGRAYIETQRERECVCGLGCAWTSLRMRAYGVFVCVWAAS